MMDFFISRGMEILRSMPEEIDRLHELEAKELVGEDWDARTQTYAKMRVREVRCLVPWEIQACFSRKPLKEHYGWANDDANEMAKRSQVAQDAICGAICAGMAVMVETCPKCGWEEITAGLARVVKEDNRHTRCDGIVERRTKVMNRGLLASMMVPSNVQAVHWFDGEVYRWRDQINKAILGNGEKRMGERRITRILKDAAAGETES